MSKNYWTNTQDFIDDLCIISDCSDDISERKKYVPSTHTRKARSKPHMSIYEDPQDEEEDENPTRFRGRGRGYPLARGDGLGPGGVPSFLERQYQTTREIRELHEVGFSNEVIENSLKNGFEQRNYPSEAKVSMPDIRLICASSSNSSSKYSTPSSSPLHMFNGQSPTHSPSPKHKINATVDSKATQQFIQETSNLSSNAPPIYDILKLSKGKLDKNLECKTKEKNGFRKPVAEEPKANDFSMFTPPQTKNYDLKSNVDFPELS